MASARPRFLATLDFAQRMILVVGFALVLLVFGQWVTHVGGHGLVGYRPMLFLRARGGGIPRWARLLIWLALVVAWAAGSVWLLRQPHESKDTG